MPENNYSATVKPYDRLFLFLSRGGDSGYVFCRADNLSLIAVVNRRLVDDLAAKGKKIVIVHLSTLEDTPIATQIVDASQNADTVIVANLYEVVSGKEDGVSVVVSLNFAREVLWQTGKPIVFWGDGATMSLMANYAPDLYSQRRQATIEFTEDDVTQTNVLSQPYNMLTDGIYMVPDGKVTEDKINWLQQQLHEAESKGAVDRRVIADVVLPLANKQATQGNNEAVKKLLDIYQAKTEQYAEPEMLTGLGDIYRLLNEYDRAAAWYRKANLLLEQQSMERAGVVIRNEQWYNNLIRIAETLARNGKNLLMLGELEEAITHIQSLMSAQKQSLLAGLWLQMGDIVYTNGNLSTAEVCFQNAIDCLKEIKSGLKIQDLKTVCNAYYILSLIHIKTGQLTKAKTTANKYSELIAILNDANSVKTEQYRYEIIALLLHADISVAEDKKDEALNYYNEAKAVIESASQNTKNTNTFYHDLIIVEIKIGDLLVYSKDIAGAKVHYNYALENARKYINFTQGTIDYQRDLCVILNKMSSTESDINTAQDYAIEALQIAEQLAEDNPHSEHIQTDLSGTYFEMGRIKEKLGEVSAAEKYYRKSLKIVAALAAKNPDSNQIKNNRRIIQQHIDALSKQV